MAKMVILVLFLFLSVCAQADKLKDTLFLQKTDPHHLYYADKDVVLESSVSLFEIIYDNITYSEAILVLEKICNEFLI